MRDVLVIGFLPDQRLKNIPALGYLHWQGF